MNQLIAFMICAAMLAEGCRDSPDRGMPDLTCIRPYTAASIWNVPIDWNVARIHPQSDQMMAAFFESSSWIGTDASQNAANVYFVTTDTPLVPVKLRSY
ncbi:MAG: hypothetical protein ACM3QS_08560, partial [Bacteroidota bacterium]